MVEGRGGPTPPNPEWPAWNVDCLDACGAVYQQRWQERPTICGVCGGQNVLATRLRDIDEPREADQSTYRRPGKPRLPRDLKKTEKIVVSLTPADDHRYRVIAAQRGYKNVSDWARDALEREAQRKVDEDK